MDLTGNLLAGGVAFVQNLTGIMIRPYETYRRLVARRSLWELVYLGVLLLGYFTLASLVKTSAFRPFLLTRQFVVLAAAAATTYLGVVGILWAVGRKLGGKGTFTGIMVGWGYTLVPTLVWFFITSLLYVVLPPPRSTSTPGVIFSIVYLIFSVTLFWWKLILAYLTLRFGLRLDLQRIILVALVAVPIVSIYSVAMYWLGIFRVPFL
ncbi:hypothetical protein HY948_05010 [Candidatus Gottesmanbacteria bacterium]|nr:hypothetical protein [Candidatus Gottesmanbacteria bacterium]